MIFYFSGTGNSRWTAEQIAALTGDKAHDITKPNDMPELKHQTQIGLVFPVYAWGAPEPMLKFARSTKAFYTTAACNGCGLCAQNCPACTIRHPNGKPAWSKQCYQCLRCINECLRRAIQYGKSTETRSRYTKQYVQGR